MKSAGFPVLIASPIYKQWNSIAVFFGGSANALNALKLGIRTSRESGISLDIFTQLGKRSEKHYKKIVQDENLEKEIERHVNKWHFFEKGKFEDNLYEVPHDALVVLGAYGHGIIRDILFGSKMEKLQSTISNNLLIAGPKYAANT